MKNLKSLREQNKLTQQQMAEVLGIQRPTYTRYENGERQPDYDTLLNIARYFNVSVDYLLGREEQTPTLDKQLEGIEYALYGELHDLTDSEKEDILSYVKFKKSQRGE